MFLVNDFFVSNGTVNLGMNSFDVQMQIGITNWGGECLDLICRSFEIVLGLV
jgi:hypothetical protein